MMIRSMSPEVLVVDEIGREEDTLAVLEAVNAGIKLIITTHGHTLSDIERRPFLATIIEQHIFERFIELKHTEEGRQYKIFNSSGLVWKAGAS